jgi:hypothetical protein
MSGMAKSLPNLVTLIASPNFCNEQNWMQSQNCILLIKTGPPGAKISRLFFLHKLDFPFYKIFAKKKFAWRNLGPVWPHEFVKKIAQNVAQHNFCHF